MFGFYKVSSIRSARSKGMGIDILYRSTLSLMRYSWPAKYRRRAERSSCSAYSISMHKNEDNDLAKEGYQVMDTHSEDDSMGNSRSFASDS